MKLLGLNLFSALYKKMMLWSRHPHAIWYLGAVSFAESSFFPIPPDVMLAPMSLATPKKAWLYAWWTTVTSIFGAALGYLIGSLFFLMLHPWITKIGYEHAYQVAVLWFHTWGFWAICFVNYTPFPYKIFTIAAGALAMPFWPFLAASLLGRGSRFFLVAWLMRVGGEKLEQFLLRYIDYILWFSILLIILCYLLWRLFK